MAKPQINKNLQLGADYYRWPSEGKRFNNLITQSPSYASNFNQMSTINTEDIKKLDRCLVSGSPVLFTGAGFSLGATKRTGEMIPSGNELKTLIVKALLGIDETQPEFEELSKVSLSDVCSYATTMVSEHRLKDFIVEHLAGFQPRGYHETILSFDNWKKIYTVNFST